MDETKQPEFTVRDRRKTAADEEGAAEAKQAEASPEPAASEEKSGGSEPGTAAASGGTETGRPAEDGTLPALDFPSFILSLAASVQASLGLMPDPRTKVVNKDLQAAQQIIDVIGMLKDKTKGNVTREEEALIDTVLYNLRMLYIRTREGKP